MGQSVEKTKVRAGANPPASKAGLFSRPEMESLVKSLAGPSWGRWMGYFSDDPIQVDQKLSALSDEELEKVLTEMLEEICQRG